MDGVFSAVFAVDLQHPQ